MQHDHLEMPRVQGGRRFGPLPEEVCIGSDPSQCHICLQPPLQAPAVALVMRRGVAGWTLEPAVAEGLSAELARDADAPRGRAVRRGARMLPGDTLLLRVGRQVARFTLTRSAPDALPPLLDKVEAPPSRAAGAPTRSASATGSDRAVARAPATPSAAPSSGTVAGALASEASRQASARVFARSGTARQVADLSRQAQQGRFTGPTLWAGLLIAALGGLLGVGGGLWWWLSGG